MKKMFLAAVVAMMAMGSGAYAAYDGFDDESYDVSEPAAAESSDEDEGPVRKITDDEDEDYENEARSRIEETRARQAQVEEDEEDDEDSSYGRRTSRVASDDDDDDDYNYKSGSSSSNSSSTASNSGDKPGLRLGVHVGAGYGSFWNIPAEYKLLEDNPYDDWMGVSLSLGGALLFPFNQYVALNPEFNFGIRGFFKTLASGYWYGYSEVQHEWTGSPDCNLDENLMMYTLEIPVLLRLNPNPKFYLEAGVQFALTLSSEWTLTISDNRDGTVFQEGSLGTWKCESSFVAMVFGLGTTLDVGGKKLDLGARVILDMTNLEPDQVASYDDYDYDYDDDDYYYYYDSAYIKNTTRMWTIQLTVSYWM